jgi:hypothetical protein
MAKLAPAQALGHLPITLREELVEEFAKITQNYRQQHWEAAELDGGRFCEIVYTILAGHTDGDNYPARASKPAQFKQACENLASRTGYTKSARLTVPRVLVALYDIRNQRGVGHVGGDVIANHMDATFVLHAAQWVMAELVRMFHDTDTATATAVVAALVDRTIPLIWRIGDITRILDPAMSLADQTLLLLYASPEKLGDKSLAENLEQDRLGNYRRVLSRLHDGRLIEYNKVTGLSLISPTGVQYVEDRLLR